MPADELALLKDIHLPPPVHMWPLAPGWLILYCVAIFIIGWLIYRQLCNYFQNRAQREALTLLTEIHQLFLQQHNLNDASIRLNNLLKRVTLVYYPRTQVAELHGPSWLAFLTATSHGLNFEPYQDFLLKYPYQKQGPIPEHASALLQPYIQTIQSWIKQQRRSR